MTGPEHMNLVIVGHVDHGKSTLIGRLLADTGSLPEGKLDQVKKVCELNSRPFEYAFLLDALKDEQEQGITIDTARVFFKTKKRHYIIMDAPGHIEFLKNMITGAAHAEAALLVIDAKEGVQENSRRHGYMVSLLGIRQIVVVVNKMDLVGYKEATFKQVCKEYTEFLKEINVSPVTFVPIAARDGDNIVSSSSAMPWYKGATILKIIDALKKGAEKENQPLRMPVQDIYKFTEQGDDRRIVAGTIETGMVSVGDKVVFYPSQKESKIKSIEGFKMPAQKSVSTGHATGVTLTTQLYIKPGEIMCKSRETPPQVGSIFKAHVFWLGKRPFVTDKAYKLKLGTTRATVYLNRISSVMDASDLSANTDKPQVERHDVAECVLQTSKPLAFDLAADIEATGRFVIIDDYNIVGGGILTERIEDKENIVDNYIRNRETHWVKSLISTPKRAKAYAQKSAFILISSDKDLERTSLAKGLEETLFKAGLKVYSWGLPNIISGLSTDVTPGLDSRDEHIRRVGELAHAFTDAGLIFISTIPELDDYEAEMLSKLVSPHAMIIVNYGPNLFHKYPVDCLIPEDMALEGAINTVVKQVQAVLVP